MAKRRARARASGTRVLVALATALVLLAAAAAVALLVLSHTGRGRRALAQFGAARPYAEVQAAIESQLRAVLPGLDVAGAGVHCGLVGVPDEPTWWEWQDRIARAVDLAGGRVLRGERLPGDLLRLELGVPGQPTHALLLYRSSRGRPDAAWGGAAGAAAWASLAAGRGKPTIALVIDDWGYGREDDAQGLLDLDVPLTLSVLPGLPYSSRYAREATPLVLPAADAGAAPAGVVPELRLGGDAAALPAHRREVILHLPMEPVGYPDPDPGPHAILTGMDRAAIAGVLDAALASVPGARGLNNHMGSAATADVPTMAALMQELHRRGLFFLDSQTTERSAGYAEAGRAGVLALRNRIFLDHDEPDPATVRRRLGELAGEARARGFAVGIGHPHAVTAHVLAVEVPRLEAEGVRFVTLSELLALRSGGR